MPEKPRTFRSGPPRPKPRDTRPSSALRGYDRHWRKLREAHLAEHPLCAECLRMEPQRLTSGEVVDHVQPFSGVDDPLRLDPSNLETLCWRHHSMKTAARDRGFGNPRK